MKRVVQNKKEETIDLDSIDWTNPHIGVFGKDKHFLHSLVSVGGFVVALNRGHRSGYSYFMTGETYREVVEYALSCSYKVYVFDSSKELFLWLAE